MASKKTRTPRTDTLPFGAGAVDEDGGQASSVALGGRTGSRRAAKSSTSKTTAKKTVAKKSTSKKATAKKSAAKKAGVKKSAAKKTTAKKTGGKKAATKKTATKKKVAKKAATKKVAVKKPAAGKTAAKKTTTKKAATAKATAAKKAATRKSATKKTATKKTATKTTSKRAATKRSSAASVDNEISAHELDAANLSGERLGSARGDQEMLDFRPGSEGASERRADRNGTELEPIADTAEAGEPAQSQGSTESPWTDGATLSRRAEKRKRWKERRQRRSGKGSEPETDADDQADQARDSGGVGDSERAAQPEQAREKEVPAAKAEPSPWALARSRRKGAVERTPARSGGWERRPTARTARRAPEGGPKGAAREVEGILVLEKMNHGHLRSKENHYFPTKLDPHVSPQMVQRLGLREGSLICGRVRPGQGRHRWELSGVSSIDGKDPRTLRNLPAFKKLTSIDPDFHYAVGDDSGEVSLKVVDILCPIGRGQRGLIVAPPRSGKTVLMQQFAHAIESIYPEVHLMVLLLDERPEEATEWKRSLTTGEVFVSTNDESPKCHVELAEVVWARAKRLVEMGEDVILLLDSITRMGRAYNNVYGNSGKTMSGGIDSRALERPKQFFGAARNTETAGSLTILGTTLIETGSRMDQVIFEEFKGTGNMELVLARRLADRRIFPAIDLERSGTRKEEKLLSSVRHRRCTTLRRVLMRMHWAEAMELLITKLDNVEKIDDFLQRFDIDPEA